MSYAWSTLTNRPLLALTALAGALGLVAGCVVLNTEHCAYAGTGCADGFECSMCAIDNNGCVPAGTIAEARCVPAVDGTTTAPGPTGETLPDPPTTDPPSTTDEPTTTTLPPDPTTDGPATATTTLPDTDTDATDGLGCDAAEGVVNNPKCIDGTLPYCDGADCVSCEGIDCADIDPDKPTCEPVSGVCLQCLVDADCKQPAAPHCDAGSALCQPCSAHEHCPDSACDLGTGECFPEDNIIYVRNRKTDPDKCVELDNPGTDPAKPLCLLQTALTRVKQNAPAVIKVQPTEAGAQTAQAGLPPGAYTVAILPWDVASASLSPNIDGVAAVDIAAGNRVFIASFNIFNTGVPKTDPGVLCDGATLWLDRVRVYNTRRPLRAQNCELHLRRVVLTSNSADGVDVAGPQASLAMENSYVTSNGGGVGGVRLRDGADADILYSTIALNSALGPAVVCTNAGQVKIRNSALVGPKQGDVATLSCPVMDPPGTVLAEADGQADAADLFSAFTSGEFRADPAGPLRDAAAWTPGDPATDFDGTARPELPGPDYAGADVP